MYPDETQELDAISPTERAGMNSTVEETADSERRPLEKDTTADSYLRFCFEKQVPERFLEKRWSGFVRRRSL